MRLAEQQADLEGGGNTSEADELDKESNEDIDEE
jgi:hypothetical protein